MRGHATLITRLLASELANALRYKPDYNKERLAEAMNHFYKLHLCEAPIDSQLLSRSSEIAFRGNVTVYDAIPVALAVLRKTKSITADHDTQHAKLKPRGYPHRTPPRMTCCSPLMDETRSWPVIHRAKSDSLIALCFVSADFSRVIRILSAVTICE